MSLVKPDRLDHVHLYVRDRAAAIGWYTRVLGMREYGKWRQDNPPDDHPVFLATANGVHVISLFVGDRPEGGDRTVAFHLGPQAFLAFARLLPHADLEGYDGKPLTREGLHDYGMAMTFNFLDPAGNHIELVTYDTDPVRAGLAA
ncbi:hypothetical protein ACMU_11675 [Actibacterium mucosum KCTC 23349]|uniref:VOC domain-containing protein n=1 Tax=Actibacterium mucosum KCTC 23349 TaxID=1454373 RepID=A0A037ZGU9_9RHOB|nr:VOC family protein [Actibacterium mucosum]KAJ55348.1 hypothetical protein ACMU_11675 [Actibacterium mucosum KCTC 23349]